MNSPVVWECYCYNWVHGWASTFSAVSRLYLANNITNYEFSFNVCVAQACIQVRNTLLHNHVTDVYGVNTNTLRRLLSFNASSSDDLKNPSPKMSIRPPNNRKLQSCQGYVDRTPIHTSVLWVSGWVRVARTHNCPVFFKEANAPDLASPWYSTPGVFQCMCVVCHFMLVVYDSVGGHAWNSRHLGGAQKITTAFNCTGFNLWKDCCTGCGNLTALFTTTCSYP